MLRVLGTIQNSEYANTLKNEQNDLAAWVKEIHNGMYPFLASTHLTSTANPFTHASHQDTNTSPFPNYVSQPISSLTNFLDASSTALLASTVYRLSIPRADHSYLLRAEKSRKALSSTDPNNSSQLLHFMSEGWLTPDVNLDFPNHGEMSLEGQASVIEIQAGW